MKLVILDRESGYSLLAGISPLAKARNPLVFGLILKFKMDSRFRGNDGVEK